MTFLSRDADGGGGGGGGDEVGEGEGEGGMGFSKGRVGRAGSLMGAAGLLSGPSVWELLMVNTPGLLENLQ